MYPDFEFDDFDTCIQPEERFSDNELIEDDEPFVEDGWDGDTTGFVGEDDNDSYEDDNPWPYENEAEPDGFELYDEYNDGEHW